MSPASRMTSVSSSSFVNTMSHSHSETPALAAEFESRLMQCILGLIVLIPASSSSVFHGWKPNNRKTKGGNQGEMKATKGKRKQRKDEKTENIWEEERAGRLREEERWTGGQTKKQNLRLT